MDGQAIDGQTMDDAQLPCSERNSPSAKQRSTLRRKSKHPEPSLSRGGHHPAISRINTRQRRIPAPMIPTQFFIQLIHHKAGGFAGFFYL
jgi:hypothetical protein